ncbi:MAG: peptidylprolyl isomerase [Bacteroidetes bacterium]|nr:MAG: peptidylprolyl isomerase [Bacteroidota bacterium]
MIRNNGIRVFSISLLIVLLSFSSNFAFSQKKVIDKVVAIVGGNEILYSDIENQYMQYLMQGYTTNKKAVKCQIFEEVLFAKLLLNEAQLDSVEVSDEMVEGEMDRRLQYFVSQIGSQEKLEKYYNKSILEIKNDLRTTIHEQMLSEQVKNNITKDVSITPTEVRDYFKSLPKDSIPLIGSEYQYSSIIMTPKIQPEEKEFAKHKLEGIRERIVNGESFESLARMYSEDPGSAMKGGELGDFSRGVMYPEFEAAAFSLQPGELSPIVETEAGYHIIKLIKRKGDYINVRHILIMTKISPLSLEKTKKKMDSIYQLVANGDLTFEAAALHYSDDNSKFSGGVVINPASGSNIFTPEQIEKTLFFSLERMNVGEVSKPSLYDKEKNAKAFRIVRLDKRSKPHKATFEQDYDKVQAVALNVKKSKAVGDWIMEKSKKTYIIIIDDDLKSCDFKYNWE